MRGYGKKVVYFHGLGGNGLNQNQDVLQYFAYFGIDLVSPTVDHQTFMKNPHLFPMLEELCKDADYIVGNSMGGYFAYHLGKSLGKKTLLFNPAISKITTSYNWFNSTTNYTPADDQEDTLLFLATHDDVVDHRQTRAFLTKEGYDTNRVENLVNETHSLDFMLIVNKIFEFTDTQRYKTTTDETETTEANSN